MDIFRYDHGVDGASAKICPKEALQNRHFGHTSKFASPFGPVCKCRLGNFCKTHFSSMRTFVQCVRTFYLLKETNNPRVNFNFYFSSILSTLNCRDNNLPVRNCNVCKLLLWQWWKKFPIPNRPVWMQMASIECPYLNSPWANEWEFLHRCEMRNKTSIEWKLSANDVVPINQLTWSDGHFYAPWMD